MTKASQIMALHKQGKTTRQIAEAVYGLQPDCMPKVVDKYMAYVRVVVRQRKGSGRSEHDLKYMNNGGQAKASARKRMLYHTDQDYRAADLARTAAWQRANRTKRNASQKRYRERKLALAESANQTY